MNNRFTDALAKADRPLIMEIKRQDADGRDLLGARGVAETVERFEAAGAPCLSVVTGHWFGGSENLLKDVAARTALPLLRKDFITNGRQLERTRELGASAVLLTARVLPATALARLTDRALELGLTPFVEVADEAEVALVRRGSACVVAVNNKDIAARERLPGDPARSRTLLPSVRSTGTRLPVSASGIADPVTAARLIDEGFAGLLIGTGLLRAPSVTAWCAAFDAARKVPARGRPGD
ncbi:indole-3-glycerol phosphate synthase TrpC [Streptomyces amakusaensis]|uniref:indole-3-glycerol-phosphate synthase n=1 Tax=Streptomyces amakusaensis TaxID=67271 RepID=A0ABW0AQJ9_9ACTN